MPLYSFNVNDSHTFTNCTATDREGPTLSNCQSSYATSSTTGYWYNTQAYFNVTNGVQLWSVPVSGTYKIKASGARGGQVGLRTQSDGPPGQGAYTEGNFDLTEGDKINIIVGQSGQDFTPSYSNGGGSGGGGASWVCSEDFSTLLCVGGGGGGAWGVSWNPSSNSANWNYDIVSDGGTFNDDGSVSTSSNTWKDSQPGMLYAPSGSGGYYGGNHQANSGGGSGWSYDGGSRSFHYWSGAGTGGYNPNPSATSPAVPYYGTNYDNQRSDVSVAPNYWYRYENTEFVYNINQNGRNNGWYPVPFTKDSLCRMTTTNMNLWSSNLRGQTGGLKPSNALGPLGGRPGFSLHGSDSPGGIWFSNTTYLNAVNVNSDSAGGFGGGGGNSGNEGGGGGGYTGGCASRVSNGAGKGGTSRNNSSISSSISFGLNSNRHGSVVITLVSVPADLTPPIIDASVQNLSGTDNTPSFTFTSNEAGTIDSNPSYVFSPTSAINGSNTITFNTLAVNTYSNIQVYVTDAAATLNVSNILTIPTFTISAPADTTAPIISANTQNLSGTNNTPSFTFTSNEAGTIITTTSDTFSPTSAINGLNIITFNTLAVNTYNIDINVTDAAGNVSNILTIPTFTISASPLGRSNYGGILTKGTTSERDAISSPSSGDTHYNTTTNQMNIYADGNWNEFALTIPTNQVALLSGSTPPGSALGTLLAGAGGLTGTGSTQGIATESDYQPNNYISFQATAAFNGTLSNTSDFWGSDDTGNISSSNPKLITFEFPNDVAVGKYKIWPRAQNGQHNPKTWKLFAYLHNSGTPVEIDSRTEENWNATSTSSVINDTDYNEYTTNDNATMYRKFELNITDTHDPNKKYVKIGELAFYGPGSANNNNVFYKNTNPYNLQVYRNGWKTLPLELTNGPSFSYGLTIPSNSSGNTGNVFYDTSNQIINLHRNNQWYNG